MAVTNFSSKDRASEAQEAQYICSAVDTLANGGVNFAMRLSGMSNHHQSVWGSLSVVAQRRRENRGQSRGQRVKGYSGSGI